MSSSLLNKAHHGLVWVCVGVTAIGAVVGVQGYQGTKQKIREGMARMKENQELRKEIEKKEKTLAEEAQLVLPSRPQGVWDRGLSPQ